MPECGTTCGGEESYKDNAEAPSPLRSGDVGDTLETRDAHAIERQDSCCRWLCTRLRGCAIARVCPDESERAGRSKCSNNRSARRSSPRRVAIDLEFLGIRRTELHVHCEREKAVA